MQQNNLFSSNRIFTINQPVCQAELLEKLAVSLYNDGLVKTSFANSVLLREKEFPTGIFMESHSVAIPHTEFAHVCHTGFAVAINHSGVPFYRSDATAQTVIPKIIVMMAIDADCEKVTIIQSLFTLLASQQQVDDICKSTPEKIVKTFTEVVQTR